MRDRDYEIVLSDAALEMLDSHVDFLARVSADAAAKLVDEILGSIASLARHPERFPAYDNPFVPRGRYRKMLSARRYLILYEIDGAAVYVDYIIDCRQDDGSG